MRANMKDNRIERAPQKILGIILAVMSIGFIARDTDLVKVVSRQLEASSRELTGAMILAI